MNILVTGTPGVGKSAFCTALASRLPGMRHVDISALAKAKDLFSGMDTERGDCPIIDEDKVCDELEDAEINIGAGGVIVEYHGCDFFPVRYFQRVVVLMTDNTILWNRLEKRGYPAWKVQENVQAEIMRVVLDEAAESYPEDIVKPMQNDTVEHMEDNVEGVVLWAAQQA